MKKTRFAWLLAAMLLWVGYALAQNRPVSGKISDADGQPLSGATVAVKGTTITTITQADGSFSLQAPPNRNTLVISYVGYQTKEVSIEGLSTLNTQLAKHDANLEDVVVVGYGTRKKSDVTGAVSSINSEKIQQVPTTNLTQALQGRIAGIEATPSSFRPGEGSRIRIRGNRSLSASNDPLYVVDGIPVSYTIDDMNPADIETVDVLKDASSTAIYGVRGANGVVQITTKKGRAGKIGVEYSGSVSFDNILKHLPVYDGPGLVDMWRQAFHADKAYAPTGVTGNLYYPDALADFKIFGGNASMWNSIRKAYQFRSYDEATNTFVTLKRAATADEKALMTNLKLLARDSVDIYDPSMIPTYPWQDAFLRTGITNSHSINLAAGTDKIRTSFSGSYYNQKGIELGQNYIRYTVGNNTEFKPVRFLTVGNSISYTNSLQNAPSFYGSASGQIPFVQPYDANGNFLLFPNGDRQIPSPANNLGNVLDETKVNRVFGNVYAEVQLLKGLRYKAVFGLDSRNMRRGTFNGTNTSASLDAPASAGYAQTNSLSWIYDNLLYYTFKIGDNHNFNITALHEMQSLNKTDVLSLSANNLIFEQQKWYSLQRNTNATVTGTGSYTASQLMSLMGRIEYGYKNKYLITLSNRYDNSSVLAEGKQGEFFPSTAIAWQISNEDFFDKQSLFSSAKLRFGIGRVGNSSIGPYQTAGPLDFTNYNWGSGTAAIGLAPITFPVPNLTWEKTTTTNIGIEFGMFRNRLNAVIDLYKSSTKDMLQTRSIPATNGVSWMLMNLGEVQNKGVDITLGATIINQPGGLRWNTDVVFSLNREKIVDIDGSGQNNLLNLWFLNEPARVYYSWVADGIYQYSDTAKGGYLADYLWPKGTNRSNSAYQPGKIRVRDINGDSLIDAKDKMILGYDNADWTGSISNTLSYKNFELSALIYIRKGGMYRVTRPALVGRFQSNYVNYWTPTNPGGNYQQPTRTSDVPVYWESLTYRDGSFARVRNISLTYRFPQSITSKLSANNLALYVNAVNPFLFHKKSPYDPETVPYREQFTATTSQTGPTSYSYRSVVLGIRLGF